MVEIIIEVSIGSIIFKRFISITVLYLYLRYFIIILSRNWGKKFVEANESYALLGFKIKSKMASSNGYSFMLIWNGVLPEDVEFEAFTRFTVQKVFRDQV